jgi:hypothetical protein
MRDFIERLIYRIDNIAADLDDLPATRLRKTLLIFLSAAGVLLVPWGAVFFYGEGLRIPAFVIRHKT